VELKKRVWEYGKREPCYTKNIEGQRLEKNRIKYVILRKNNPSERLPVSFREKEAENTAPIEGGEGGVMRPPVNEALISERTLKNALTGSHSGQNGY